jgi:hypothetical protein
MSFDAASIRGRWCSAFSHAHDPPSATAPPSRSPVMSERAWWRSGGWSWPRPTSASLFLCCSASPNRASLSQFCQLPADGVSAFPVSILNKDKLPCRSDFSRNPISQRSSVSQRKTSLSGSTRNTSTVRFGNLGVADGIGLHRETLLALAYPTLARSNPGKPIGKRGKANLRESYGNTWAIYEAPKSLGLLAT